MLREKIRTGAELSYLRSWSTLGTPFLTFGFRSVSFWSAVPLALVLLALVLPLSLFNASGSLSMIEMWEGYVNNVRELLLDKQYAPVLLLPMLWMPILFAVYWYLLKFGASIFRRRRAYSEMELSKETYEVLGAKHLAVWSRSDEGMNGLRSTLALSGSFVPRWAEAKTSTITRLLAYFSARSG